MLPTGGMRKGTNMSETRRRGWHPDPFGIHHERFYYANDQPGRLVRDSRLRESFDDPPHGFVDARSEPEGGTRVAPPVDYALPPASPLPYEEPPVQWAADPTDGSPTGWVDAPTNRWTRLFHELKKPTFRKPTRQTTVKVVGGALAVLLLVFVISLATSSNPHRHRSANPPASRSAGTLPTAATNTVPPAVPAAAAAQSGWQITNGFADSLTLNGLSCPTVNVCVAVGSTKTSSAFIVGTTNGGTVWTQQHVPAGVAGLNAISCPSTSDCIAVGSKRFVETKDAGLKWSAHSLGDGTIVGISCGGAQTCVAVGTDATTNVSCAAGRSFTTTDGGSTWTTTTLGCFAPADVTCSSAAVCEVIGQQTTNGAQFGQIMNTADTGSQWGVQYKLIGGVTTLTGIACSSANVCTVVGGSLKTPILGTSNGGKVWTAQPSPPPVGTLSAIGCANTQSCQTVAPGFALTTDNGGQTWGAQASPGVVASWQRVSCPSPTVCYGVGESTLAAGITLKLHL